MSPFPGLLPPPQQAAGLPQTNLTAHFNAADITKLWQTITAGNNPAYSNVVTADGQTAQGWSSTYPAATSDLVATFPSVSTQSPLYKASAMAGGGSVLFDGSDDAFATFDRTTTGIFTAAGHFTTTAKTIIVAFQAVTITLNSATSYQNHGLIADIDGFMGIYIRDQGGGVLTAYAYNWDGNEDKAAVNFAGETDPHVVCYRHDGTNVYCSVDGGVEASATSGTTADNLNQGLMIGRGFGSTFFNVHVGEFATWNAALTGATLTQAITYFTDKWL